MYCGGCKLLLTSPLFDICPRCGYPVQVGLEKRVENYVEDSLTPSIWQALHSSSKCALLQAEQAYHMTWLTREGGYDLETVRRLYARTVALEFEHEVIIPFKQEFAQDLQGQALGKDLANNRVYWLAKYVRKILNEEAYPLSIQQLYLLLTYLGGKNIRQGSFLVSMLRDFMLSCERFHDPARLWRRTKHVGECRFRLWVGELAFFDHRDARCYSSPPLPIHTLEQLHRYRRMFYTLEDDSGLPLFLNVVKGISTHAHSATNELRSITEEQILTDYSRYLTVQEKDHAKLYRGMPSPIVATRHAIETSDSHHSRFVSALRCAECIAAYCTVIATAERLYADTEPPYTDRQDIRSFFVSRHAAFGSWLALLNRSVDTLVSKGCTILVPEVVELARSPTIGILKKLKRMRDMEDAHAMPYADSVFADKLNAIMPSINEIYEAVVFLRKYPLVMVKRTENLVNANRYVFLVFTGTTTDLETKDCPVELRLSQHSPLLLSPQCQSALPLAPFLVYEPCDTCHQEELFFLDIIDQQNKLSTYRSLTTNHRKTTDRYEWLFSPTQ